VPGGVGDTVDLFEDGFWEAVISRKIDYLNSPLEKIRDIGHGCGMGYCKKGDISIYLGYIWVFKGKIAKSRQMRVLGCYGFQKFLMFKGTRH
jgi:hypothetical protein